ncbi:MAG: thymidine kinase [Mollicutes bacterium]|nr:thymidine kinase [Mollicutes bacterium]
MADLSYIYGVMEAGKTSKLLQDVFNYRKNEHNIIVIKPLVDKKGGNKIISRIGDSIDVDILISPEESFTDKKNLSMIQKAKAIFVDEAQFLSASQIKELWLIAHLKDVQVFCYGLKTDFRGIPFEGSCALFGYADSKTELITRCPCGNIANMNARVVNEEFTREGDVVAIDGIDNIKYIPLCSDCYISKLKLKEDFNRKLTK